jgi:hypothetical protein
MACPVIIRRHDGSQSYLVLDGRPGELRAQSDRRS